MKPVGYQLFERYLLHVNEQAGKIRALSTAAVGATVADDSHRFVISSAELLGLEELWRIITQASDVDVGRHAIELLCSLHQFVGADSFRSKQTRIRETFLASCLAWIEQSLSTTELQSSSSSPPPPPTSTSSPFANDSSRLQCERSLMTLLNYLRKFEFDAALADFADSRAPSPATSLENGTSNSNSDELTLRVLCKYGNQLSVPVMMRPNDTLQRLRDELADRLDVLPRQLRLFTAEHELLEDNRTLYEMRIDLETVLVRVKGLNVIAKSQSSDDADRSSTSSSSLSFEVIYDQSPVDDLVLKGLNMMLSGLGLQSLSKRLKQKENQVRIFFFLFLSHFNVLPLYYFIGSSLDKTVIISTQYNARRISSSIAFECATFSDSLQSNAIE
jgi:hypothetical protein